MGALLKHRRTGAESFSAQGSEEILLVNIELAKEEMAWRNACERLEWVRPGSCAPHFCSQAISWNPRARGLEKHAQEEFFFFYFLSFVLFL